MDPVEICRHLGESKNKAIFLELTTDGMKKILREAKLPTTRMASHTTSRKRNDDWAARLWRTINAGNGGANGSGKVDTKPQLGVAATLLFEWLTRSRRPMLADFLTALGVQHENGLTDGDFMSTTPHEKLVEAGKRLLGNFNRQEVAAYLLFLDASNKSEIFAPLGLPAILSASSASPALDHGQDDSGSTPASA